MPRPRRVCSSFSLALAVRGGRASADSRTENRDRRNQALARDIVKRGKGSSGGPSADQGCAHMPISSNKFTSCSRKRQAGLKSVNNPSDVAILSMAVDSQPLFRRGVSGLLPHRENERIDDVFQALLSEANRELAILLRDVGTEPHGPLPGNTRSQPVSELLMR